MSDSLDMGSTLPNGGVVLRSHPIPGTGNDRVLCWYRDEFVIWIVDPWKREVGNSGRYFGQNITMAVKRYWEFDLDDSRAW